MCEDETCKEICHDEPFVNRLMIKSVSNGYVVRDSEDTVTVFEVENDCYDEDKAEVDAMRKLLYFIVENYGVNGSRYAKHRIQIEDVPGDKYEPEEDVKEEE